MPPVQDEHAGRWHPAVWWFPLLSSRWLLENRGDVSDLVAFCLVNGRSVRMRRKEFAAVNHAFLLVHFFVGPDLDEDNLFFIGKVEYNAQIVFEY